MKRVIIICEGETEQTFCSKRLAPFFLNKEIIIQAPPIKISGGGIVQWIKLKDQIREHLIKEPGVFVTTLIDYYGVYNKHNFPRWNESLELPNKNERMDFLESAMKSDIHENIRYRCIPYIQLHEFEGLLFNDIRFFNENIPKEDVVGIEELNQIFSDSTFENPEMINNTKNTSPSHRLKRIIKGYSKVVHGDILAEAIGLERIRDKCPRFNNWLNQIENI